MNDEVKNEIALLRYAILSPLISETNDEGESLNSFFIRASKRKYPTYDGKLVSFAPTTMERWYYNYKRDGFEGLIPKRRIDSGNSRKLDDDLKAQIQYFKKEFPRLPATLIYQKLFDSGSISKGDVSLSTITRYINQLKIETKQTTNKDLRRFEHEHCNFLWYADTSVGLSLTIDGKKMKTYVICFLDDRSRYVTGVDIFFNDSFVNVMSVMKSAISKHGKPKIFSFDNGSPYKNKQMEMLVARIGSTLNYTAPYTPTSKGKLERFFNTMKSRWMSGLNPTDLKSLDELRLSLKQYVHKYNTTPHSSLEKQTPKDVFFSEPLFIRFLDKHKMDKIFLLEYERSVTADSVITIDKILYEVPYRYAKQRIRLRYAPDLSEVYIVDKHSGELEKISLLKKNDNARIKRESFMFTGGDV